MSYIVNNPCWNCGKAVGNGGNCTDGQKLQEGVNAMYTGDGTHQGAGQILLSCHSLEQKQPACK